MASTVIDRVAGADIGSDRIRPSSVRYIKLGQGGSWLDACLDDGIMRLTDLVPHVVAASGDWIQARQLYIDSGSATVTTSVRELRDFYEQPSTCLWVTFGKGRLWWAFAEEGVTVDDQGFRVRRMLAPWSDKDVDGRELRTQDLSSALTQTASYQRTICSVAAETYLLRRLNAEADPLVSRIEGLKSDLLAVIGEMIADLHWRDFEVLVDLIFAAGGWRRISAVGGSGQADSDLILQQPVTGERAFVQIKSRATPATFADYLARAEAHPMIDRFIFACHTPTGTLELPETDNMHLWLRPELASRSLDAGLLEWLIVRRR